MGMKWNYTAANIASQHNSHKNGHHSHVVVAPNIYNEVADGCLGPQTRSYEAPTFPKLVVVAQSMLTCHLLTSMWLHPLRGKNGKQSVTW